MLVLTREIGQVIRIGHDIRIMVTDIRGDKVRIGIEAPADAEVHRQEIYEAIHREQEAAEHGTRPEGGRPQDCGK